MSEPLTLRMPAPRSQTPGQGQPSEGLGAEGGLVEELVGLDEFEARVREGRLPPSVLVRFPVLTQDRFVPAGELEIYQRLHRPRHAYFARYFRLARFPWLTTCLAAICVAVHGLSVRHGPLDFDGLVLWGAKVRPLVTDLGQGYRLLTANFLHRDGLHLGLNLFVLFTVGGALENAYRAFDYLWLLLFSGVATMTASLFLSEGLTVGASGMVYGCLGALVVFGLKYRSILPSRYRRILGEAAVPTLLVFLWLGWTSAGVDNAAHLGGLLAGLCTAPFLRPWLLTEPRPFRRSLPRAIPAVALLVGVVGVPILARDELPLFRGERDDGHGLSIAVPLGWKRGAPRLGELAYVNGLPGVGRATFAMGVALRDELVDADAEAAIFIKETLRPGGLGEGVEIDSVGPVQSVPWNEATRVEAVLREPDDTTVLEAYFVPRGELVYQLVFTYSRAFPRYARVIEQMRQSIVLDEPRALREARGRALLFPESPAPLTTLGETLRRLGRPGEARRVLEVAVKRRPDGIKARSQLAQAWLQLGHTREGCEAAEGALLYGPGDPAALEASARCELSRQNPAAALARLRAAREADPINERLIRAAEALERLLVR